MVRKKITVAPILLSRKNQEHHLKPTPLEIIIKMPNSSDTSAVMAILEEINTTVPDPEFLKHFSAQQQQENIKIHLTDSQNTQFCNGFLIALSDTIKARILTDKEPQEKITFVIKGEDAAGAAACLASCGLWGASYYFENTGQEQLFLQYHQQVVKNIEAVEQELNQQIASYGSKK